MRPSPVRESCRPEVAQGSPRTTASCIHTMDLPELLAPERIRCRLDIQSKKRALQTLAELLGQGIRPDTESDTTTGADASAVDSATNGPPAEASDEAAEKRRKKAASRDSTSLGDRLRGKKHDEPAHDGLSDMDILDALISRERLGSTGLGHGVALPHSRVATIESPLAAMITLNDGVDFEASDSKPVDLLVGLLVPENCNDDHLKILANLARRFNEPEFRDSLRAHEDGNALYAELHRQATNP